MAAAFGLRSQTLPSNTSNGRHERLERERMSGFERRSGSIIITPPPQQHLPQRYGNGGTTTAASRAPRQQQTRPPPPPTKQVEVGGGGGTSIQAAAAPNCSTTAVEVLTKILVDRIIEEIRPLRSALDAVTLRCSGLENETKSLKNSLSSLRDEISGISQATGGASTAQKATEVGDNLRTLQKAFGDFSAKKDNETLDHALKIVAVQNSAEELAQNAYERSISVACVVTYPNGIEMKPYHHPSSMSPILIPSGAKLVLRYPMKFQDDDESIVCMLHTFVSPDGDVLEYSVPVQINGRRTISFHEIVT
jgi:hypothetical protein